LRRAAGRIAALLLATGAAAALAAFAFPGLVLDALLVYSRREAGLALEVVELEGGAISYLQGGSGPSVVLLHGFGGSKETWLGVAGQLAPRYRVIVPDLPGFGASPARDGDEHGPAQQADRVHRFLAEIGVGSHHLAGLSMGGEIAGFYAARHPEALRSLLLVAAPGVRAPVRTEFIRRVLAGENPLRVDDEQDLDALFALASFRPRSPPGILKRAMVRDLAPRQELHERILADIVRAGEDALGPLLPGIAAPTLLVWGAEDRLVHPSSVAVFEAALPEAESAILPECGHAVPVECRDALLERYLPFLEAHP
jgi:pimeloyl-ACP methyl ester carboxylesterase